MSFPSEFAASETQTGSRVHITPSLLREWPLPEPSGSKYSRGEVLIVGGARSTPGAAMLAAISALRVGAGRLTLAVARSVAIPVAVAIPESGVIGLDEDGRGSVRGKLTADLRAGVERADAILIGSGLDEPEQTAELLAAVLPEVGPQTTVVLDAFALGVLIDVRRHVSELRGRLVLTPNGAESSRLLGIQDALDPAESARRIARDYGATVTTGNNIADERDQRWTVTTGHSGLGTSGSGDVLAGAVVGLLARGADPTQAACWATHLHAAAGDRLTARIGQLGFLARELADTLPAVLTELRA